MFLFLLLGKGVKSKINLSLSPMGKLRKLGRHESVTERSQCPRVPGSIPTGGKLFDEFIFLFTTKQYKNANIAKFE